MEKAKAGRRPLNPSPAVRDSSPLPLADLGISYNQSSRWQKLAAIPDDQFEATFAQPNKPSRFGYALRPAAGNGEGQGRARQSAYWTPRTPRGVQIACRPRHFLRAERRCGQLLADRVHAGRPAEKLSSGTIIKPCARCRRLFRRDAPASSLVMLIEGIERPDQHRHRGPFRRWCRRS